ncbi:helix-turn-helix transcriptional regulator [Cytobacillus purgationiresistens]|uniref:DNA-binding transcriptional regulator YafY n=1 Tax=Cytobacillus purgationiresistens TaxID=863449 RepID=A0ABU0AI51_9BACI|nr:YafY family protein [Cytobacillus purgationiresistens]MDQ0270902.1 putative DNA-binding transcriptional regulator YafY [Cytobacillus purgationiresistens]
MSKADHMLSIIWLLKTRKKLTAKELAERLEINIRSVYRYIDSLCASGVPIVSEAGHNGGYSMLEQFKESPLVFHLDEQKALIHAAAFAREAGYPFGASLNSAIAKLKNYTTVDQLQEINQHASAFEVITPTTNHGLECFLQQIEMAAAGRTSLLIEYQKNGQEETTLRKVDPYGLIHWKSKWYITAFCHLRNEVRSFRVDRVHKLEVTDALFEKPAHFSPRDFFLDNIYPDLSVKEELVSIHIEGEKRLIDELCEHWFINYALLEKSEQNASLMLSEKSMLTYLPHILLHFGKGLNIIEPPILKEKMIQITSDLLHHYQKITSLTETVSEREV